MTAPANANRATICRRSFMNFVLPDCVIDVARADYRGRVVALSIEAEIAAERSWMPPYVGLPPQICCAKPRSLPFLRLFQQTRACLCGVNRRRSGCRVGPDGRTIQ